MSTNSYCRCWVHIVWATLDGQPLLDEIARAKVSVYLTEYAASRSIPVRVNYIASDHAHTVIDLPTNQTIEDVVHLLKGSSSHWINENKLTPVTFAWDKGYQAFSVSHTIIGNVAGYLAKQPETHKTKSFRDEMKEFAQHHGMPFPRRGNR
ncbi:MAG TPA: transposase [Planctomycetota bacterium]|nr:transposase [Planctomycetota bacterium]